MTSPRASSPNNASGKSFACLARPTTQAIANLPCSYDYDYSDIIIVLVGEDKIVFPVYKDLICENSRFFQAACAPDRWLEGNAKMVPLPHVNPNTFKAYYHWVVSGSLLPEMYWDSDDLRPEYKQEAYIEAYILGDFLDDAGYRNEVIATMIAERATWRLFSDVAITRIWEATSERSSLRIFTLEWMLATWRRYRIAEIVERGAVPNEFIKEAFMLALHMVKPIKGAACDENLRRLLLPRRDDEEMIE
jgi:hypothetical protein